MSEELMITKEDLVNWLDRPPSNDDLDLIGFITTRLENFYKLEQENKQLKERIENTRNYIKWHYDLGTKENVEFCLLRDRLLEILGEKENESNNI